MIKVTIKTLHDKIQRLSSLEINGIIDRRAAHFYFICSHEMGNNEPLKNRKSSEYLCIVL